MINRLPEIDGAMMDKVVGVNASISEFDSDMLMRVDLDELPFAMAGT